MTTYTHAWVHHCGEINLGVWRRGDGCGGCRASVEHAEDVQQFALVPVPVEWPG